LTPIACTCSRRAWPCPTCREPAISQKAALKAAACNSGLDGV
jgi:hypothetical protein